MDPSICAALSENLRTPQPRGGATPAGLTNSAPAALMAQPPIESVSGPRPATREGTRDLRTRDFASLRRNGLGWNVGFSMLKIGSDLAASCSSSR
jgi:hypothetical protein